MSLCEDCGEEGGNHASDCWTWEQPDELRYDASLDPISPSFDWRRWDEGV